MSLRESLRPRNCLRFTFIELANNDKSKFLPIPLSPAADLQNFRRKIEAGADSAITQYFFNVDAYFRFVDDCEALGLTIPITPGIMPNTNYKQLARFSDACGDDLDSIRAFGLDTVGELCQRLLHAGAPGLHFYTLNRAAPSSALWERLGL